MVSLRATLLVVAQNLKRHIAPGDLSAQVEQALPTARLSSVSSAVRARCAR